MARLTTRIHDRDSAGLQYVYPVVSRRARGVSVGINLNPNQACNWRCVYCQVPGLVFGNAPEIDLDLLERELAAMLEALVNGDYMSRHVPEGMRRLNDVALSGDGEPTSSPQFARAIEILGEVLNRFELIGSLRVVLITNGSLTHRPEVQRGLSRLAEMGGEVWYKLDSATDAGARASNNSKAGPEQAVKNLKLAAKRCPTWVQTCVFALSGTAPSKEECEAYLRTLGELVAGGVSLEGVLLYGLARPSHQPEAPELSRLPADWLEAFAHRIEGLGLRVQVDP